MKLFDIYYNKSSRTSQILIVSAKLVHALHSYFSVKLAKNVLWALHMEQLCKKFNKV